ncbi:MAG: hypothetical protein QGG40_15390, partial [Myxococcota bacterium]|nr:hypothetical protein [Myxococcota bacterium]
MRLTAQLLQDLGFLLYGGPMVAFAILVNVAARLQTLQLHEVVRSYRAWGSGLGIALGTTVLGGATLHWLNQGALAWSWA